MKLNNKIALVTGASSGIGRAVALRFAQDKCKLIITGRSLDRLNEVKEKAEQHGAEVLLVVADVTVDDDLRNIFVASIEKFGRIDVFFNNAGLGFINPIVDLTEDEIHKMIDTNITAMILGTKYAAEQMK